MKKQFEAYKNFEVVDVADIAVDDVSEHLKGVSKVIHAAAPIAGKGDTNHLLSVSTFPRT